MLPLYKILSLIIRVFARPLVNKTKQKHFNSKLDTMFHRYKKDFFIWLGNYYH